MLNSKIMSVQTLPSLPATELNLASNINFIFDSDKDFTLRCRVFVL